MPRTPENRRLVSFTWTDLDPEDEERVRARFLAVTTRWFEPFAWISDSRERQLRVNGYATFLDAAYPGPELWEVADSTWSLLDNFCKVAVLVEPQEPGERNYALDEPEYRRYNHSPRMRVSRAAQHTERVRHTPAAPSAQAGSQALL